MGKSLSIVCDKLENAISPSLLFRSPAVWLNRLLTEAAL
jgi:hypothetical protein